MKTNIMLSSLEKNIGGSLVGYGVAGGVELQFLEPSNFSQIWSLKFGFLAIADSSSNPTSQ